MTTGCLRMASHDYCMFHLLRGGRCLADLQGIHLMLGGIDGQGQLRIKLIIADEEWT